MPGTFVIGDETFVGAKGKVSLVREYEDERPHLNLEIAIEGEADPDKHMPRLVLDRLQLEATDWASLEGTRQEIPDPVEEDDQDQNLFWGPHFENVLDLVLQFGRIEGDVVQVTIGGVAMQLTENEDEEEAVPFSILAACTIERPPPPAVTAAPPAGRKVCHACKEVSFDLVERCPSCDVAGWWNPS